MSGIIWIIIVGFIAGIIARLLSPGPNNPSGFILTTVLGIAGAFLATFIGQAIGHYGPDQGAGFITATIGALVVLFIWNRLVASGVISDPGIGDGVSRHPGRDAQRSNPRLRNAHLRIWLRSLRCCASLRNDGFYSIRCIPASIRTNSPVMLLEAGEARKQTSCAISSAVEATFSGTFATTASRTALAPASPRPLVNQGVSI